MSGANQNLDERMAMAELDILICGTDLPKYFSNANQVILRQWLRYDLKHGYLKAYTASGQEMRSFVGVSRRLKYFNQRMADHAGGDLWEEVLKLVHLSHIFFKQSELEEFKRRHPEVLEPQRGRDSHDEAPESSPTSEIPRAECANDQNRIILYRTFCEVTFRGVTKSFPRLRGIEHLARLLGNPGEEILAATLHSWGMSDENSERLGRLTDEQLEEEGLRKRSSLRIPKTDGTWEKVLKRKRADQADAERSKDPLLIDETRRELNDELEKYKKFKNAAPKAEPEDEKARLAVRDAVKRAIETIKEAMPALATHLHKYVKTTKYCWYRPDEGDPVNWIVKS